MKNPVLCFPYPSVLRACFFALACLTSVGYASPQPSNVHFCLPAPDARQAGLPLDFEERERDSLYAARKQALNLNVGQSRTVRMIYFLPNDRPYRAKVVDSMKVVIRQIRTFYAEQMQAHGYGDKTFRIETDAQGEPIVHRLDGQHPDSHYLDNTNRTVLDEVGQVFDRDANIYLLVIDNSINAIGTGGRRVGGTGGDRGKNGGYALVHGGFSFRTAAHELGHAFGLSHDFNDDAYIMSYGSGQRRSLSACSAEFLAVHPYFNPSVEAQEAPPPTIELISQTVYPTGSRSVSVQLKVSDSEGLHQVLLFVKTREPHFAAGSLEVKACRGLEGKRDAVVEFDYNGVIPSDESTSLSDPNAHPIYVYIVDTDGNVGRVRFNLWEILPQHIATLEGHTRFVRSVAYSPDGTILASGSADKSVKLWDVATGQNIATLNHTSSVTSVAFSPDGTTLASGSGREIKLWDVATGRNITTLEGHESWVPSVAFSPDGTILASGSGREIKLWDVATGRNIATLRHPYPVDSMVFSPDGTTLASGSWGGTSSADAGIVRLWDVSTRRNIATLEGHKGRVTSVVFSPDGTILASGSDDETVKLWNVATRTNIATLEGHKSGVQSVAYSPDGTTLASGSEDNTSGSLENTVKLWDIATGQDIATYRHIDKRSGQARPVYSVAFSPDGTTLASGAGPFGDGNGTVILWDVSERIRPRPQTLVKISGDNQQGPINTQLNNPFVVEVRDQYGNPLQGAQVTFTVTAGEGKLSGRFTVENTTADANGRAERTLSLGSILATNTVEVSVAELEPVTFNAVGVGTPTTPIMGGDYRTWHLPDGAIVRLGKGDIGGSDRAVAFSPDGQRLAVASGIGVWLYDVATSRELALFTGHSDKVTSVAFSPDGTLLASGSADHTLKLWDVATRTNTATLRHRDVVHSVTFSPDGTSLAATSWDNTSGAWDNTVKLWDVETGRHIATLSVNSRAKSKIGGARPVAFSPDGTTLASEGAWDNTVRLWDVATRTNIATLEGHTFSVFSVAFSPDGTTLASGSLDGVKLWDVATGENIATLQQGAGGSVAFSPDGTTLALGSRDRTVKLWDVVTRTNIAILEHTGFIGSVAFSPDGTTLASGVGDGTVRLWNLTTQNIATLEGHTFPVRSVAFSPDGTILALGSRGGTVRLWDIATRTNVAILEHTGSLESVAFSPDGTTLAVGGRLWDVSTGENIATLEGNADFATFSPDGRTLAGSDANTVKLWDISTGENIATLEGHTGGFNMGRVQAVAFSSDGATLASGSRDRTVKLWDVATRENIATLSGHGTTVESVAFSSDGATLASGSRDRTVKLWDVATGENIATLRHSAEVMSVAFSPDGTTLASSDAGSTVRLWDVAKRENIVTLEGHTSWVRSVAFSPDGTMLASGSLDGTVLLWNMSELSSVVPPSAGSNANAVLSLDLIADGGAGNQKDDGVVSGTVSGQGTKIAVEVFATGVKTPLQGIIVKFDFDSSLVAFDKAENSAFALAIQETDGTNFASTVPVTISSSNFLARAEFTTVADVTGRPFSIGIKVVTLAESETSSDDITTTKVISFNAIPPTATFSLSLDGDGAAGDQAVTTLDVSPRSVVSIQIFGKDIRDANGVSARFEYDAAQVAYEGFDPGGVLPNAQVIPVPHTNPTAVEINMVSFGGQAAADSGLVGSIRFRTTDVFSGTTLRLVRAELGRGEQSESVTLSDTSVTLKLATLTPDFNRDGRVNFADFLLFGSRFGASRGDERYEAKYDLDEDGTIGFGDFLIFGRDFGKEGS